MLILTPLYCFAHGEDVLVVFGSEIIVLLAFILALIFLKLKTTQKGIILLVFIITEVITYKIIEHIPYSSNAWLINLIVIASPIITIGISYLILRKRKLK